MTINDTRYLLLAKGPDAIEFNHTGTQKFGNFYTWFEYKVVSLVYMLEDPTLLYYIFYCTLAILGHFYLVFFYAIQILAFSVQIPTLGNVIKSITRNKLQLVLTGMLISFLLYIYTVLGFFFFSDAYFDWLVNKWDDTTPGENLC